MNRYIFAALICFLPALGIACWGNGSYAAVAAPVAVADGWHKSANWPGWYFHVTGGTTTAWYHPATKEYQAFSHGRLVPMPAPWEEQGALIGQKDDLPDWMLRGVDRSKLSDTERVTINGREIAKADALDAIEGPLRRRPLPKPNPQPEPSPEPRPNPHPNLPDDSAKLRLTCIGTDVECRAVQEAVKPLNDKLVMQSYRPGDWALRPGFIQDGHPTIYLQAPDGKVLLRRQELSDDLVAAIRKADPAYDPAKDPDGRPKPKPEPAPLSPASPDFDIDQDTLLLLGLLGLAGLGVWHFTKGQP